MNHGHVPPVLWAMKALVVYESIYGNSHAAAWGATPASTNGACWRSSPKQR